MSSLPQPPDLPDRDEEDDEDAIPTQSEIRTPEYHMSDEDVEQMDVDYSIRGKNDWVISGPLGQHGVGTGRRFPNIAAAEKWVRAKYSGRVKYRIAEATLNGGNRWAYLIKGD